MAQMLYPYYLSQITFKYFSSIAPPIPLLHQLSYSSTHQLIFYYCHHDPQLKTLMHDPSSCVDQKTAFPLPGQH
jgi:hypothetical protein